MTLSDSDRLLVNDGSETNTITFAQFKDGSVLNPTDLFLVNDGTKTETISWEQIEDELGPKGVVNTPTVLKPKDGAGSGDERFLKQTQSSTSKAAVFSPAKPTRLKVLIKSPLLLTPQKFLAIETQLTRHSQTKHGTTGTQVVEIATADLCRHTVPRLAFKIQMLHRCLPLI